MKKSKKESKIETKTIKITEMDYRGLLALTLAIGFVALIAICIVYGRELVYIAYLAGIFTPILSAVIAWYYKSKSEEK